MYFDVVDMADSNLGNNRIQGLNNLCVQSTRLQFYGMSNGVAQMVSDIKNALGGGQIDALRIWGNGGPGLKNVTAGVRKFGRRRLFGPYGGQLQHRRQRRSVGSLFSKRLCRVARLQRRKRRRRPEARDRSRRTAGGESLRRRRHPMERELVATGLVRNPTRRLFRRRWAEAERQPDLICGIANRGG